MDRLAKLVVALDDRNDRVEEMMEELEHSYEKQSTATDAFEKRLERVESRLDQLDRVEEKLDRLLAVQNAGVDGGQ
jgi:chromosome segregation ATPase